VRVFFSLKTVLLGIFILVAFLFIGDVLLPLLGQHAP
jgi:hypothetical protein